MTAFGEQEEIMTTMTDGLTDEFFTRVITFSGVDHVEPFVEGSLQNSFDRLRRGFLVTDFGATEPEDRNVHIGFAQASLFHRAQNLGEKRRPVTRPCAIAYQANFVLPVPRTISPMRRARKND